MESRAILHNISYFPVAVKHFKDWSFLQLFLYSELDDI